LKVRGPEVTKYMTYGKYFLLLEISIIPLLQYTCSLLGKKLFPFQYTLGEMVTPGTKVRMRN
jgi:hypothetical protein